MYASLNDHASNMGISVLDEVCHAPGFQAQRLIFTARHAILIQLQHTAQIPAARQASGGAAARRVRRLAGGARLSRPQPHLPADNDIHGLHVRLYRLLLIGADRAVHHRYTHEQFAVSSVPPRSAPCGRWLVPAQGIRCCSCAEASSATRLIGAVSGWWW